MKINWLGNFIKKKQNENPKDWRSIQSIYQFLQNNSNLQGELAHSEIELPDEVNTENEIKFSPGLSDALFGSIDSTIQSEILTSMLHHFKQIALSGNKQSDLAFHDLVSKHNHIIGVMDPFIEEIHNEKLPITPYLFQYAKDLMTKSEKRNAVKMGITVLGLCQNKTIIREIKFLGLHNEFTLFSSIAINNLLNDPIDELWDLAKKVKGWGRIYAVNLLAPMRISNEIKDWLILEGFKITVTDADHVWQCAKYGELHLKLESKTISPQLFTASSDIIKTLLIEDSNLQDHPLITQIIQDFIKHSQYQELTISNLNLLHKIKEYLIYLNEDNQHPVFLGWDQNNISNLIIDIHEIISSRNWLEAIMSGLKNKDLNIYWDAREAARLLKIDLWDTMWHRINENPTELQSWYDVTKTAKPEHSEQVIELAISKLPIDVMATGPKDSFGSGPNYNLHACLLFATEFLEHYPQKGEKILLAALNYPVTANRNAAIKVLKAWTNENWSETIVQALQRLYPIEPNAQTKTEIKNLLRL